jgi:hypothetical protein
MTDIKISLNINAVAAPSAGPKNKNMAQVMVSTILVQRLSWLAAWPSSSSLS